MPRLARLFLLVVFALLQGLAPLLHAHAGGSGHGGFHLPASLDGSGPEAIFLVDDANLGEAVFSLASSLEARDPVFPVIRAFRVEPLQDQAQITRISLEASVTPVLPPLLASWRTPAPVAPPRA